MRITGEWLSRPQTQTVCAMLVDAGYRALFVGGCVRNTLLHEPVSDIDIATDAPPETVMALADAAGLRCVPTGLAHGTVLVVADGTGHEITTLRRDVATDGRHATVAWTDDVADDARRRDFTMNALYALPDGSVVDPLNGLPDTMARRVRFVGDPHARIAEDYLRILRFFRFHAWYGDDGIDADGLDACAQAAERVEGLSRERVGHEMRRLLAAKDPVPALASMSASGVLGHVLPGAAVPPVALLCHMEHDDASDWLRRLAALGGEDVTSRLALSRAEARDLAALRDAAADGASAAVLGWRLGKRRGHDALLVRAALLEAPPPPDAEAELARGAGARFPVAASDLMPDLTGPALGARLKALEARWIASDLRLDREALLAGSAH
jgi:poly(A) polymerase